jgi:F-type H+-transporting ATPase subunit delta
MNQSKISVRYAKALFLLAKEKSSLDEVYHQMKIVEDIVNDSLEFRNILKNAVLSKTEKRDLIKAVFGDFNKIVFDFLILLVDKDRLDYIVDISRNFSELYRKDKNIIRLTTTTIDKLSDTIKSNILKVFKESYNCEIEIVEKIDSKIIGGIIFRIENEELNMSVTNQLSEIKKSLLSEVYTKKIN